MVGLVHHRGHEVVAVDGDHISVADALSEEEEAGHLEGVPGEPAYAEQLAPSVLTDRQVCRNPVQVGEGALDRTSLVSEPEPC